MQSFKRASLRDEGRGEVRVRAHPEVHLHPHPQVRNQVGENLFKSSQVQNALWQGTLMNSNLEHFKYFIIIFKYANAYLLETYICLVLKFFFFLLYSLIMLPMKK